MIRRRENRLHQASDHEPDSVPSHTQKRFRNFRSQQTTHMLYGVLLGSLIMLGGVVLADELKGYAPRHPLRYQDKPVIVPRPDAGPGQMKGKLAVETCNKTECLSLISAVLPKMNSSVQPCNKFYDYACQGFSKYTKIPDGKNMVNKFSEVDDLLKEQLLSAVNEEIHVNEIAPFKLAKNLFKHCMDKKRIEEQDLKPLLDNLEMLGGWPMLEGDFRTEVEPSMKDLRMLGYSTDQLLDVSVGVDLRNTSRRIIYVDQATLGISREDLVEGMGNPNVIAYFKSMVDMAVLLGADEARAKQEFNDSLKFEIALAEITLPNEERHDDTALYHPMSVKEFQSRYPYNNWLDYFNVLFMETATVIDENEIIVVKTPSFMAQLGPLLEHTSKRTVANYVMWRVIKFSSSFLPEQLSSSTVPSLENELAVRSKKCVDITARHLPLAVAALYAKNHFDDVARRAVLEMVNKIKEAFVDILKTVDWMDESTQKTALEKLESMVFHIGYPDELMDASKLTQYYQKLEIKPEDSYLNTVLYIDRFSTSKMFKMLRQAVNNTDWTFHSNPADVNVRYSFIENSIQVPPHYLQVPFYSYGWPNYMNYGTIASVIGREITRGFDDLGRQFDKTGNPEDWWEADTAVEFSEKSLCIMKQYDNYTASNVNLKLSGHNTVAENMADNGGMKLAYYAYKKWAEKWNATEPDLPGLNLTPAQLFWLSAAQTWCSVYRPEDLTTHNATAVYSPAQYRVLGSMSNAVDFSEDFNCPPGSPMNPVEKCKVW